MTAQDSRDPTPAAPRAMAPDWLALAGAPRRCCGLPLPRGAAGTTGTTFTITGRGWGHGIGMSQWGAYGYAKHGWTYKRDPQALLHRHRLRRRSPTTPSACACAAASARSSSPAPSPTAPCTTGVQLRHPGRRHGDDVTWVNGKYRVTRGRRVQGLHGAGHLHAQRRRRSTLHHADRPGRHRRATAASSAWCATDGALHDGQQAAARELPARRRAARGVAVVAGSRRSRRRPAPRAPTRSARATPATRSTCTAPTRDQVYDGRRASRTPRTNAAIKATAGVVPTYDGAVIAAFYFSTSGGHTENIENSWQTLAAAVSQGRRRPLRHLLAAPRLAEPRCRSSGSTLDVAARVATCRARSAPSTW